MCRDKAVAAASYAAPGQIATLILPRITRLGEADGPVDVAATGAALRRVANGAIADGVKALTAGQPAAILLGGAARCAAKALDYAAPNCGEDWLHADLEYNNARMERGAGACGGGSSCPSSSTTHWRC